MQEEILGIFTDEGFVSLSATSYLVIQQRLIDSKELRPCQ